MGCSLCEHCTAVCCHYIALPIDEPDTKRDFDDMRWYLMHEGVTVFIEDGDWFIQFKTKCRNLQTDFKCGVYETRPTICREYKDDGCDYVGGDYEYDELFTEPEQIVAYGKKVLAAKPKTKKRKKKKSTKKRKVA
jgi:uncharacterized protein